MTQNKEKGAEGRPKWLACSMAGHDKGKLYVVLRQEEPYLFLVNGTTRTLEKPKRKKQMHVQIIRRLPEALLEQMGQVRTDADVRSILKNYSKSKMEVSHVKD